MWRGVSGGLLAALMAGSVWAADAEPCSTYTVGRGDTLRLIAESAYGSRDQSPIIYNANRSVVGSNPNAIEVGMVLTIPCADGSMPSDEPEEEAEAVVEASASAPEPEPEEEAPAKPVASNVVATPKTEEPAAEPAEAPAQTASAPAAMSAPVFGAIRLLGIADMPPFSMTEPPAYGFATQIMNSAYLRSVGKDDFTFEFLPGRLNALNAVSDGQGTMVGFPWMRPDCEGEDLTEETSRLCEDFVWSSPMFETVMTFYMLKGSDLVYADSVDQLTGIRICRPEAMPLSDLTAYAIVEPAVTLLRAENETICFEAMLAGGVDIVAVDYLSGESAIRKLGIADEVVENAAFTAVQSLYAISPKTAPGSGAAIQAFNDGLDGIARSGEWQKIIAVGLQR